MKRTHWGTQLGFILATAGSAVGIGNIWRFPYMAGQNGGGAFLLLYVLCVVIFGYFLMLSKIAFGRLAQSNIFDGFNAVAKKEKIVISKWWGRIVGSLALFNAIAIKSVYIIVTSWVLFYLAEAIAQFLGLTNKIVGQETFSALTSSVSQQLFWASICIVITSLVIIKGVQRGIEKISIILMPVLFALLVFMAVWMVFIPNASKGLAFYFLPNWQAMGFVDGSFDISIFANLLLKVFGQVIYSLSIGMGVVFVYGSYLSNKEDIVVSTRWVLFLDAVVAVLAGLIVLPAVFAFNLEPDSGPSLSFITLPMVFKQMFAGEFFMMLFFALLFIAALTSLISIYEFVVNTFMEKLNLSRIKATCLAAFLNFVTMFMVVLSFTDTIKLRIFKKDLFSFIDVLTGSYALTIMVLISSVFMGWVIPNLIIKNIEAGHNKKLSLIVKKYIYFSLRYMIPVVLIILLVMAG